MLISLEINDNKTKDFIGFLKKPDVFEINQAEPKESGLLMLLNERLEEYRIQRESAVNLRETLERLKIKYGL
jgi:hypothetical protein